MPLKKLIDFLEENEVKFTRIIHSTAYTAQVIAHRAHISGKVLAKTIILKDGRIIGKGSHQTDRTGQRQNHAGGSFMHFEKKLASTIR